LSTPLPMVALPWASRSTSSTRRGARARAAARLTAVVVLPTPLFWLATAMMRAMGGASGTGDAYGPGRAIMRISRRPAHLDQVPLRGQARDRQWMHGHGGPAGGQRGDLLHRVDALHRQQAAIGGQQVPADLQDAGQGVQGARGDLGVGARL